MRNYISLYKTIPSDVRKELRGSNLEDNLSELQALGELPPEQQMTAIQAVLEKSASSIKKWRDAFLKQQAKAA